MIQEMIDDTYRVLRELGSGGMGQVYLVENVVTGRQEALKILHSKFVVRRHFIKRFRREARAILRLDHCNVVALYKFGHLPDRQPFLSAEYVEGASLRSVLKWSGRLSVLRSLGLLRQLATAIAHAHSRCVIHRDLKPENLMISGGDGRSELLKVLDFGIAKIVAHNYRDSVTPTHANTVLGTPAYMAPELIRGDGDDPRIDIYALGCIAFEMVVGEPPFSGHPSIVLQRHAHEPPPRLRVGEANSYIPLEYEQLVLRCLAKNPDERFQTGEELLDALEHISTPDIAAQKSSTNTASLVQTVLTANGAASGFGCQDG